MVETSKGQNSRQVDLFLVVLRFGGHCVEFMSLEKCKGRNVGRGWGERSQLGEGNKRSADGWLWSSGLLSSNAARKKIKAKGKQGDDVLQKGKRKGIGELGEDEWCKRRIVPKR